MKNVQLFRELCEQAIETRDPRYLRDLQENIDNAIDLKRRDLNLEKRRVFKDNERRPLAVIPVQGVNVNKVA